MNTTTIKLITFVAALLLSATVHAAGTAINETGEMPDASAILDARSTTKGFLPPRMTAVQRGAITSPATGLQVYQTDGTAGLYQYNGSTWSMVGSGSVSSVGLSMPDIFSVSNSPVTGTGTLTATLSSQAANTVLVAPNGSAGAPTFRTLTATDIPTLNQNSTGTAANVTGIVAVANGGTGTATGSITGTGALTFAAAGTNQNVTLSPSGTGYTLLNGGVGIGTTTPVAKLHLSGGDSTTSFTAATIALGYSTTGQYPHFIHTRHQANSASSNAIDFYTSDGTMAGVFPTNAILGMTITNGKVGIGTTTPGANIPAPLEVYAPDVPNLNVNTGGSSGNSRAQISMGKLAESNYWQIGTDTPKTNANNFYIFQNSAGVFRMIIDANGHVLFGTPVADPTYNRQNGVDIIPNGKISIRASASANAIDIGMDGTSGRHIDFYTDNGTRVAAGGISSNTSTTYYNATSDRRLKENITPTHFSLADLMNVQIVDYSFLSDATKTVQTGVIAQDLQLVYPGAVTEGSDDVNTKPWSVDYGKLTPLLVKAVQDLKTENDALKTRLLKIEKVLGL
jgi:hypothetical protein